MACTGCELSMHSFSGVVTKRDDLLEFLRAHNVIARSVMCPRCDKPCRLTATMQWVCEKVVRVEVDGRVRKSRCPFNVSLRRGTWFGASTMTLEKVALFTMYWACLPPPRTKPLIAELDMSPNSVVNWSNFCRELCIAWLDGKKAKLGGVGVTVEIDEAKLGKNKYGVGRGIEGQWVFGGYERGSKNLFVVPVEDRTKDTLLAILKEWVLPDTTVISDCWRSYNCLQDEGFEHLTVNHSCNFVDPDTGAHTQNIERCWRDMRACVPRFGRSKHHYYGYLAEFLWKRSVGDHKTRIYEIFMNLVAALYDPNAPRQNEESADETDDEDAVGSGDD